jgi:hypothetical protein
MPELIVPDALPANVLPDDDRLSLSRELVGRRVFSFDGPLDAVLTLAETMSAESRGQPVLVNDVTAETDEGRIVDVYMHQGGERRSVSEGVPRPDSSE